MINLVQYTFRESYKLTVKFMTKQRGELCTEYSTLTEVDGAQSRDPNISWSTVKITNLPSTTVENVV